MMKILMLLNFARGSHSYGSLGTPRACRAPLADEYPEEGEPTGQLRTCMWCHRH